MAYWRIGGLVGGLLLLAVTVIGAPACDLSPSPAAEEPAGSPCERVAAGAGSHERLRTGLRSGSYTRGAPRALVTIAEFSDFQCPFSARVQATLAQLLEEYDGDLRVLFLHNPLPLHPEAPLAHQAALAAGEQGQFWAMHDQLFLNQGALDRASIEAYADRIGLDPSNFRSFLDGQWGLTVIDDDRARAHEVGATVTPTFFINGRKLRGARPIEQFRAMIDEELAIARALVSEGLSPETIYACLVGR